MLFTYLGRGFSEKDNRPREGFNGFNGGSVGSNNYVVPDSATVVIKGLTSFTTEPTVSNIINDG